MTNEKDQIYEEKIMAFAIRIVKLKNYLNNEKHEYNIADQIQRSGTAIGANHREAIAAESEVDFVHKLTENADFHADYIIVCDAGNTEMNRKGTWNVVSLLRKVINLMMNRIDKMQRRDHLYMREKYHVRDEESYPHYAYSVLEWIPVEKGGDL